MEIKAVPTPELTDVATQTGEQKNKEKLQSNKKVCENDSFIRIFFAISKWSDTLELLGCIFLLLLSFIIGCELARYGLLQALNIPNDAILYRYQFMVGLIINSLGSIMIIIPAVGFNIAIQAVIKFIFLTTIKRYYIPRQQSYKWWQTKFVVCFRIVCIITLVHIVIVIELGRVILIGSNFIKPFKDPWIFYRALGLAFLALCSISSAYNISRLINRLNMHLK